MSKLSARLRFTSSLVSHAGDKGVAVHFFFSAHIYKFVQCCRTFQAKLQLQRHNSIMHSKLYLCETCPFQTKYYHNLISHIESIHDIKIGSYSIKNGNLNFKQPKTVSNWA